MWKNMIKNLSIILFLIIFVLIFAVGCSFGGRDADTNMSGSSENLEEGKSNNQIDGGGKYAETVIDLPNEFYNNEESLITFIQGRKGQLELYGTYRTAEDKPIYTKYILQDNGDWVYEEPEWINDISLGIYLQTLAVYYGRDNNYYGVYATQDGQYHLIKSIDEKEKIDIDVEDWTIKENDYYPIPVKIEILANGMLIAAFGEGNSIVYEEGKKIYEFIAGEPTSMTAYKNTVLQLNENYSGILEYSAEDNRMEDELRIDAVTSSFTSLYANDSEEIYLANVNGIVRMAQQGTLWEKIIDGEDTLLSNEIWSPRYLQMQNDAFYIMYKSMDECKLMKYSYEMEIPAERKDELTIYSLKNNKTIRSAISNFKMSHPEIKVNYIIADSAEGATTTADLIRAFNTKLFAGEGEDIIILDGLPVDSYIAKGVLENISDIAEEEEFSLLPNIMEVYKTNGNSYAIPARIGLPILMGTKDVISHAGSLESLADYASQASVPYFLDVSYKKLVESFYPMYSHQIISRDSGIEQDNLESFLTSMKTIADLVEASDSVTHEEQASWRQLGLGNTSLAINILKGMIFTETTENLSAVRSIDGNYCTVNNVFVPYTVIGINSASVKKETAKEFLKEVLSVDVQKNDLEDGFPLNRNALYMWKDLERNMPGAISLDGQDSTLQVDWPGKEEREELINKIESLSVPANMDQVLLEMILQKADAFLKGEADAKETAAAIVNNAKIYLSE